MFEVRIRTIYGNCGNEDDEFVNCNSMEEVEDLVERLTPDGGYEHVYNFPHIDRRDIWDEDGELIYIIEVKPEEEEGS